MFASLSRAKFLPLVLGACLILLLVGTTSAAVWIDGDDVELENMVTFLVDSADLLGLPSAASWIAEIGQAGAALGATAAGIGDVNGDGYSEAAFCAPGYDAGGLNDRGAVFIYFGSETGLGGQPNQTILGEQASQSLCSDQSLSSAGDVNGDGYDDLVVGTHTFDGAFTDQGKAYLYLGSAQGLNLKPAWTFVGEHTYAKLGRGVSGAGDVNGDGFDDVIVGAYYYGADKTSNGRAYAFYGSATGLRTDGQADWMVEFKNHPNIRTFGGHLTEAGDVNADGYDDVLIASPEYVGNNGREGAVLLYLGSEDGLETDYAWLQEGNNSGHPFGYPMDSAGDVNQDGFDDIVIGQSEYSGTYYLQGRTYVFYGCAPDASDPTCNGGLRAAPWFVDGAAARTRLGMGASGAGDVNHDGYDDVLIGAYGFPNDSFTGAAYVYYGSNAGLGSDPAWSVVGDQSNTYMGMSVARAGDLNGDDLDDILMGAHGYDALFQDQGRAIAFYGVYPDSDGDSVADNVDNCINTPNPKQEDIDLDGVGDACDNAPADFNPDQSDLDADSVGDVADPCPADSSDLCDPDGSAATYLDASAGGTITAPDGSVTIDIPSGALTTSASVSVTDTDAGNSQFELTTSLGKVLGVLSMSLQPPLSFEEPVTITFTWADHDDDDVVDGTNAKEANLIIVKDGVVIAGKCKNDPACDTAANAFTISVTSWSEFALAYFSDPVVTVDAPVITVSEGDTAQNGGSLYDFNDDIVWMSASIGDVLYNNSGLWSWSLDAIDGPESYEIALTAVDSTGGAGEVEFELDIDNVAPTAVSLAPAVPDPVVAVNTAVLFNATFSDPAAESDEPYTCAFDWDGDSATAAGQVTAAYGGCVGAATYGESGVYTVKMTVTDKDGGVSNAILFSYVVVYDPVEGFVTGGGWIMSPEGAYSLDPDLSGKATFGFVSKYKKGADVPTGNTEFQFHAGALEFHSDSYDWLVIAGPTAKFKGTGTINGGGEYGFMLTATDAGLTSSTAVDLFRIKIWDKASGVVIYDNKAGEADDSSAGTTIGGGSIVIHKK